MDHWNPWNSLSLEVPTRDPDLLSTGRGKGIGIRTKDTSTFICIHPMIAVNRIEPPRGCPYSFILCQPLVCSTSDLSLLSATALRPPRRNPPLYSTHRQPFITHLPRNIIPPSIPFVRVLMAPLLSSDMLPLSIPTWSPLLHYLQQDLVIMLLFTYMLSLPPNQMNYSNADAVNSHSSQTSY